MIFDNNKQNNMKTDSYVDHFENRIRQALATDNFDVSQLNQTIMDQITKQEEASENSPKTKNQTQPVLSSLFQRLRILAPVPVLCIIFILFCSLTAYAAIRLLTPAEVSEHMGYEALAEAFQSEDSLYINETQTSHGYDITLLGITFGNTIQELFPDIAIDSDKTYAVTALARSDGKPLPSFQEDPSEELVPDLYLTFLAKGMDVFENPLDCRNKQMDYEDGIYYFLTQCDSLLQYAPTGIYFSVNEGIRCSTEAFAYDPASGNISLKEDYDNVQALFEVQLNDALIAKLSTNTPVSAHNDETLPLEPESTLEVPSETRPNTPPDTAAFYPAWTEEQIQKLQSLSLPGKVFYIAENRILVCHTDWNQVDVPSLFQIYDYDGNLLHEESILLQDGYERYEEPICTSYGFAVPVGTGYAVYDYDFNLIHQFDMADIPTEYPPTTVSLGQNEDGTYREATILYDDHGHFSSNLQYFSCRIDVMDNGHNVQENWIYDASTQQWTRMSHEGTERPGYELFLFNCFIPTSDGRYAFFTAFYQKDTDERIPNETADECYGILSLENNEIVLQQDGEPGSFTEANNCFLLNLYAINNADDCHVIIDTTDMTTTTIPLEEGNRYGSGVFSPDGRWILSYDEEPKTHIYTCQIYDWRAGTVSEPFTLQLEDKTRAVFHCYPGGYMMSTAPHEWGDLYLYEQK